MEPAPEGEGPPPVGLITRRHRVAGAEGEIRSSAVYSRCGLYRYALTRIWRPEAPRLVFVMLNPSTASHLRNDPTVARCENRARRLGAGGFRVVNLFAFRATDPKDLKRAMTPVGPANDATLRRAALWGDQLICAWGGDGGHLGRAAEVVALLRATRRPIYHLGLTAGGEPRHPLYLPSAQEALLWD